MKYTTLIFSLVALVSSSLTAQTTFNVPDDFNTIQGAISAAATGDTILVAPGDYPENLDFLGKGLTVQSKAGPELTTISGGASATIIYIVGCPAGTTVDGFTLTGGTGDPHPSSYGFDYYGGAVYANGGTQALIRNCYLLRNAVSTGTFAGGAYSGGSGTHITLEHCVIAHNQAWASGGATLVDHSGQMTLNRCTVYGNHSDNFFGHQGGISGANGGDTWVNDCIVWGNDGNDIGAFSAPYNAGVDFYVTYSNVDGGWSGNGNINSNPLFVDSANDDFRLQANSPCIDAGNPASAPDPDGSQADMGAHPLPILASLLLSVDPLVSGTTGRVALENGVPGSRGILWYSTFGYGLTRHSRGPVSDIGFPKSLGQFVLSSTGESQIFAPILAGRSGTLLFVQAGFYDAAKGKWRRSNVVETVLQ